MPRLVPMEVTTRVCAYDFGTHMPYASSECSDDPAQKQNLVCAFNTRTYKVLPTSVVSIPGLDAFTMAVQSLPAYQA